jgi:phenylacetate-CoA ligase
MRSSVDREQIYLRLPIWVQNAIVSREGRRLNRRRYDESFEEILRIAKGRVYCSKEDMQHLQVERLRVFLKEARRSVFWNERFQRYDVKVEAEDPFKETCKLPILSKEEVKDNIDRIAIRKEKEELISTHTSGTTGSGIVFPVTRAAEQEQWAVWWRYREWHGIDRNTWCGYFGGRSLVPFFQKKPPFWRLNKSGKQLMFSAYHLCKESAKDYMTALVEHGITWLHGYPSILSLLAGYVIDQNIKSVPRIKIITTGAESLMPYQRKLIQEGLKGKVVQHYGQAEGVVNFSECENGSLHVDEDFSLVEFVPMPGNDGLFRILGTNWANQAFPLIRYDTGDIVTLNDLKCPCGRPGRIVESVDGRKEDYLILPNGVKIGRLDHIFKDLIHIREAQIVQREKGKAVFKVVKGTEYDSSGTETRLLNEARKRLGKDIILSVEYVESLPRTKSGKLRFVVSELEDGKLS